MLATIDTPPGWIRLRTKVYRPNLVEISTSAPPTTNNGRDHHVNRHAPKSKARAPRHHQAFPGTSEISTPPVNSRASPRDIPIVPKDTISGGIEAHHEDAVR